MLHDDYLMNQINVMVKYIAETIFNKRDESYTIKPEKYYEINTQGKMITYLYDLVDEGKINLAENILFDKIDKSRDFDLFEAGVDFYIYLNTKTDEFLEESDFSRQEILDGLEDLQKKFGLL